jgi:D-alanyl-D-alanine carboxypeptidase
MEHAPDYGFILRYPPEASDITGIVYEPWHYRYVGEKFAREITKRGLTLEEYVAWRRGR